MIRLTISIDLPPDGSAERERLNRTTLGELLGLGGKPPIEPDRDPSPDPDRPVRPHRPEPPDEPYGVQMEDGPVQPEDPNLPRDGRQLLGWIGRQADHRNVQAFAAQIAKEKGYGSLLVKLNAQQARNVYHELLARPDRRARRG